MLFNQMMHLAFFTDQMEAMRDFYENKLGGQAKSIVRYKEYLNRPESGFYQQALKTPDAIAIIYIEIAPGQFIEIFPKADGQQDHINFNATLGYSHFSLLVDDIQQTRDILVSKGIKILVEPKIGNSHTWQMWIADPDDNRIEIMQYTPDSFQIVGHLD